MLVLVISSNGDLLYDYSKWESVVRLMADNVSHTASISQSLLRHSVISQTRRWGETRVGDLLIDSLQRAFKSMR